jgi:hypothetical protein
MTFGHMEDLAHAFDKPIKSQEHQHLAATAWMGGDLVAVRYWLGRSLLAGAFAIGWGVCYWLGRLLRRNVFRESDDGVMLHLSRRFWVATEHLPQRLSQVDVSR